MSDLALIFIKKGPPFLHTCATHDGLPSNISTMLVCLVWLGWVLPSLITTIRNHLSALWRRQGFIREAWFYNKMVSHYGLRIDMMFFPFMFVAKTQLSRCKKYIEELKNAIKTKQIHKVGSHCPWEVITLWEMKCWKILWEYTDRSLS